MEKKQKFREVRKLMQGHTAKERWSLESILLYLIPTAGLLQLDS